MVRDVDAHRLEIERRLLLGHETEVRSQVTAFVAEQLEGKRTSIAV